MCGIVGVIDPGFGTAKETVVAMRDRLSHRGPDDSGIWMQDYPAARIGLGHRRLSIVDLSSAGRQPLVSSDGQLLTVFNGEIYNFLELRRELEALGHRFKTATDTEVLLEAYAEWGPACLERLNGMFAFLLWDERKRELFVARDRFGEKPLFWMRGPNGLLGFASEMKGLFAHPQFSPTVSESAVEQFLTGQYLEDSDETVFTKVLRFAPAHAMRVSERGDIVQHWRYWTPDYDNQIKIGAAAAAEKFRELMHKSISLRLRADVPVGTSLSGGLDSSLIVGILSEIKKSGHGKAFGQNSFSARFDADPTISEGPQMDEVIRFAGVNPHFVQPTAIDLMKDSRSLHWHQEEPFPSASIFLQWSVMRLARENGTTVLIDGQGADELLGGYSYYFRLRQTDLLATGRWLRLLTETILFNRRLARASEAFSSSKRRFDHRIAMGPKEVLKSAAKRVIRGCYVPPSKYLAGIPSARPGVAFKTQLAESIQYNVLPTLLRYADRNSMAFGREVRLPYLDPELVAFCNSLPDDILTSRGWLKFLQRKSAEGLMPRSIQWRADKVGFAAPLDRWIREDLKDWAAERLFDGPITRLPFYDRAAIEKTWNLHQSGQAEVSWPLWRWISTNEWLELNRTGMWKEGIDSGTVRPRRAAQEAVLPPLT